MDEFRRILLSVFCASSLTFSGCTAMTEEAFLEARAGLIDTYSKHDPTFAALKGEQEAEGSFTGEYWRWRIDQYLYGQYPEFQPIYDAYIDGLSFNQIYDLDEPETVLYEEPTFFPQVPEGHFTDNLPGNVHTGRSLVANGKVYVAYQGVLTDPYIASYDLESGEWDGPYKAGHSTLSKDGKKPDSHGRPILEQDSLGYFHLIFGGHGGEKEDGLNPYSIDTPHAGGRMIHVISEKPNDITSFVEVDDITPFASYTASCKMANGDIYYFTRTGTHKSPWVYYKMKSGSQTFEPPVIITWPTPQSADPIEVDTFYISPRRVSGTEIVITYLWHQCNFKEYHDRTHYNRLNTYYMTLDTSEDVFYNVKGEKVVLPITKESADDMTLAYNSQERGETCFGTRPLVLEDGRPAAAYEAMGPGYREWRMTVYENGAWTHGHPMPGTARRTLKDASGRILTSIDDLEVLEETATAAQAAVLYKTEEGESVFAIAHSGNETGAKREDWVVDKVHCALSKSKMEMRAVRDDLGKVVALVVNIRKGASQRLYLWSDGQFRPKR